MHRLHFCMVRHCRGRFHISSKRPLSFAAPLHAQTCHLEVWPCIQESVGTDDAYTVEVELPGVRKDQINVELNDRELVISGEIPEPSEEDGQRRRRSRRTGRFEFRTVLPGEVNPDGVSANLSDGVLSVKIPKAEEAKPRRIEVAGLTGSPSGSGPGELGGHRRGRAAANHHGQISCRKSWKAA